MATGYVYMKFSKVYQLRVIEIRGIFTKRYTYYDSNFVTSSKEEASKLIPDYISTLFSNGILKSKNYSFDILELNVKATQE